MDLGCGLGYTTKDLYNMFPDANVFGTNLRDTPQWFHCLEVFNKKIHLLPENELPPTHIDMIFASEFFEHIENPIEHLVDIIKNNSPDIFIIANSFNTKSIGHFYNYKHGENIIPQKNISKQFNNALRSHNYKKEITSIWNSKPAIWVKQK